MQDAPRIETDRLVLTWPTEAQIEGYYEAIVGSAMFDTVVWEGPRDPGELHVYWAAQRALGGAVGKDLALAIIEKASNTQVGGAALRVDDGAAIQDVGYAFAPRAWGRGYATEAVGALIDEAFARRGAQRVFAKVFVGNHASRRVVEKLGFIYEGTLRRVLQKRGEWLDEWLLAITRPDWEARGAR